MAVQVDAIAAEKPQRAKTRRGWGGPESAIGRARERLAWLLVAPCILIVLLVAVYPLFETFRLSLTNKRLASTRAVRYVGLDNYRTLFDDKIFIDSIRHTIEFTVLSVGFETIL